MKRSICLILAVALVFTLFAACGNSNQPTETAAPTDSGSATATPDAGTEPTDAPTEPADEGPYHLAAGKFATDERGYATEKYEYDVPFCEADDVLSFWTVIWQPQYVPAEGFGSMAFPQEQQKQTGVNIEYEIVSSDAMRENMSVRLASDDLCDIMAGAMFYYPGTVTEAIVEEQYFVNILDYKEYCPNYIYEAAMRDPTDKATYAACFYSDDIISGFQCIGDESQIQIAAAARGDWLEKVGLNYADINTFDEFENMLLLFKSQIDTCEFPWGMLSVLDMGGSYILNGWDTLAYVPTAGLSYFYVVDGEICMGNSTSRDYDLMTWLSKCYGEGLIPPDWQSVPNNSGYHDKTSTGSIGMITCTPVDFAADACSEYTDADAFWVPLPKLVKADNQVIHVGARISRSTYGSCCISAKCANIPLAVSWCDWRYSDAGSFLMSYGVQGETWDYDENGEIVWTDLVLNNPNGLSIDWVLILYTINQLAECGMEDTNRKFHYPDGLQCIELSKVWYDFEHDDAYDLPLGFKLSDEETNETNAYASDISTYVAENYLAFMDGSKPLTEWDAYISGLMSIGLEPVLDVYQTAYNNFMAG